MKTQDDILSIKRVAALSIQAIDPDTNANDKKAAWGLIYQKAYEIWRNENIFVAEQLLEDGGILDGAGTALFYRPSIPKTTDYDPEDYDWTKIQNFEYKEQKLDVDAWFKVQRKIDDGDVIRMRNHFKSGNYESVSSFVLGLVKNLILAASIKRNTLIMQNLYEQATENGIVHIKVPKRIGEGTAYSARQIYVDPIVQRLANMKKLINYTLGIIGTSGSDYALLVSENCYYTLLQSLGIQGSDRAYSDLLAGKLTEVMGIKIIRIPYLDNKFSVHEELEQQGKKWVPIAKEVDLTGIDAVLFHKNTFAYKFGPMETRVQEIPNSWMHIYSHRQTYSKNRLPILGKFCIGFKFRKEEGDIIDLPNDASPEGWKQESFANIDVNWNGERLLINNISCWKSSEEWTLKKGKIKDKANWFEFLKEFGTPSPSGPGIVIPFDYLIIWRTTAFGSRYVVPVGWAGKLAIIDKKA